MSCYAIIPARGGSKGIPKKNIKEIAGKPLIAHTIIEAKKSKNIDKVFVSTDCDEIASIAKEYGAEIIKRPDDISGDLSSSEQAVLHSLDEIEKLEGKLPDFTCFVQCTSPLTLAEDFDGGVAELEKEKADCLLAVTNFHYFIWKKDETGNMIGINHHSSVRLMRQQREPEYLETGAFYIFNSIKFRKHKHRFFGRIASYIMPEDRVYEIDDLEDLVKADIMLKRQQEQGIR